VTATRLVSLTSVLALAGGTAVLVDAFTRVDGLDGEFIAVDTLLLIATAALLTLACFALVRGSASEPPSNVFFSSVLLMALDVGIWVVSRGAGG
jgi:hypothetical protein